MSNIWCYKISFQYKLYEPDNRKILRDFIIAEDK